MKSNKKEQGMGQSKRWHKPRNDEKKDKSLSLHVSFKKQNKKN